MLDLIEVKTVDGKEVVVDLNTVSEIRDFPETLEIELYSGRFLVVAKTPEILESIFRRRVSLKEAQAILASRTRH